MKVLLPVIFSLVPASLFTPNRGQLVPSGLFRCARLQLLGVWYEKGNVLVFVDTQQKCDTLFQVTA